MTILPSSLQKNHHHTITQFKGQKCPSTFKERQYLKTWHENEWKTRYHREDKKTCFVFHLLAITQCFATCISNLEWAHHRP